MATVTRLANGAKDVKSWTEKNFKVFKPVQEKGFLKSSCPSNHAAVSKHNVFLELFFHLKTPHQFERSADERHGKNEILLAIQSQECYRWVKVDCTRSVCKVTDSGVCEKLPAGFRKKIILSQHDFERYLCFDWCWMLTNLTEDARAPYILALTGTSIAQQAEEKAKKLGRTDEKLDTEDIEEDEKTEVDKISADMGIKLVLSPTSAKALEEEKLDAAPAPLEIEGAATKEEGAAAKQPPQDPILALYNRLIKGKRANIGEAHPEVAVDEKSWNLVDNYMFLAFVSKMWSDTKRRYKTKLEKRIKKGIKKGVKKALLKAAEEL